MPSGESTSRLRRGVAWARPAHLALLAVLLVGFGLRAYFLYAWRPALIGFPDSSVYLADFVENPFTNGSRPAGYGRVLAALHGIRPQLSFVILVQHAAGLATAVALWIAVRRAGGSAWAALLPAAVVALAGGQLFVEHAVLSESLFTATVAFALLATVESRRVGSSLAATGNAALAGLFVAAGVTLRLPGFVLVPILGLWLVLGRPRGWAAFASAAALVAMCAAGVLGYMAWYESGTGSFGMTRSGFYNTYGRVASFADCRRFTPPAATARLCPRQSPERRQGHEFWIFDARSPIVRAYGGVLGGQSRAGQAKAVNRFARAAVLHQPGAYLAQVWRDGVRIVDPDSGSTVGQGNRGAGYSPEALASAYFDPGFTANFQYRVFGRYAGVAITNHGIARLQDYERATRAQGVPMALLLLLALVAPVLTRGPVRLGALGFAAVGFALLLLPIFSSMYDARYVLPALGPLACAAGLGIAETGSRLRRS